MPSSLWNFAAGNVVAPVGLILGLKAGVTLETGWEDFTVANGYFLHGTNSDSLVGTTGTRTVPGFTVGTGGGHTGGNSSLVSLRGQGESCANNCVSPSRSIANVGGHGGHYVAVHHLPASSRLRLIRAAQRKPIPLGSIMFGTAANSRQRLFDLFNNHSGLLYASGSTTTAAASTVPETTSSVGYLHTHESGTATTASGVVEGAYTNMGAAGLAHTHAGGNVTVANNMTRAVVRAFEIIDRNSIKGLIGMWAQAGIPIGWELVAVLTDRYLYFTATGAGAQSGNGTISVTGTTGSSAHSHPPSGVDGYEIVSYIDHPGSVTHVHSYGGSAAFESERYFIKFIQYKG